MVIYCTLYAYLHLHYNIFSVCILTLDHFLLCLFVSWTFKFWYASHLHGLLRMYHFVNLHFMKLLDFAEES